MRVSRLNVANRPTTSRGRGQPTAGDVKTKRGPRSRKVSDRSPALVLCFSLSAVSSELIQGNVELMNGEEPACKDSATEGAPWRFLSHVFAYFTHNM